MACYVLYQNKFIKSILQEKCFLLLFNSHRCIIYKILLKQKKRPILMCFFSRSTQVKAEVRI